MECKNNQRHGQKSPFEKNSNANRNTFDHSLVSKWVEKRPFHQNRYNAKTFGILVIHRWIYSGGMKRPTSAKHYFFRRRKTNLRAKVSVQQISTRTEDRAFFFFPSFNWVIRIKFLKRKNWKFSVATNIKMLTKFNFSVLKLIDVLFVYTNTGA